MNPKVSIIIVNWNTKDYLKQCLQSIIENVKNTISEVIVVDNNSSDDSIKMLQSTFTDVKLIRNNVNVGFAKANNQALKESQGDYILFLNPDAQIVENAVQRMVDFLKLNPTIDLVAPKLLNSDGSLQRSCRRFPNIFADFMESTFLAELFPRNHFFNWYEMGKWDHNYTREICHPAFACVLVRHETLDRIGLMDERFFMYYEEIDFCYQIKKSGGKIYFYPFAEVIHHAYKSTEQIFFESRQWATRSKLLYFKKHYGRGVILVLICNLLLRAVIIYAIFPLSHSLIGKPRDTNYFKKTLKIAYQEYKKFWLNGEENET